MVSQLLLGRDDKSSAGIAGFVSSVRELTLPDPSPNLSRTSRFSSAIIDDGSSNK
jgi:hypothetical protein